MSDDSSAGSPRDYRGPLRDIGDGFDVMPFEEQRQVHELLSQETRHHIIQTILGHPAFLPSITEFDYYISKAKPTIHQQLDRLQDEDIVRVYELERDERKRDLPYRFYGLTEYGVDLLYEYKYLRGVPIMRAITDATEKSEKVARHQNAPRPNLPAPVADALQYDEPELETIDGADSEEKRVGELLVDGAHRRAERTDGTQASEDNETSSTNTQQLDSTVFDDLFESET